MVRPPLRDIALDEQLLTMKIAEIWAVSLTLYAPGGDSSIKADRFLVYPTFGHPLLSVIRPGNYDRGDESIVCCC